MKKLMYFLGLSLALISCGSDDDNNGNGGGTTETKNYFPLHLENQWEYANNQNMTITSSFDGTSQIEGETYYNLINQSPIFGVEGNGFVRKEGDNYYYSGVIQLAELPSIPVNNELFLNENSNDGAVYNTSLLSTELDSVIFDQGGFSATITPVVNISVKIEQIEHHDNITLNGSTPYEDVLEVKSTYTLSCDLVFTDTGIFTVNNHNLVSEGEVATLTQYFAQDIGVARSMFDGDFSVLEYNTQITTPVGPIELEPYLAEVIAYFEDYNFNVNSELGDYIVN